MRYSLWSSIALVFAAHTTIMSATVGASDRSLPMRFELVKRSATAPCSQHCGSLVAATGAITADTPHDFAAFAKDHDLTGATVVLNSDGGSTHGAIALGRAIRAMKLDTTVGRVKRDAAAAQSEPLATVSPYADCESMCAFVLLAGINRTVPQKARVMVHQIWLGDRRDDPTAANYSAEDLVLVQRDIGRLAQYTAEMGASIDMLDLSLRIPPWEPMHVMTMSELVGMRVVTEQSALPAPAKVAAQVSALPAQVIKVGIGMPLAPVSERRWTVVNNAGSAALGRRHPLTLEGDEIGRFDLMVACSNSPDSYDVSYVEYRSVGALPPAVGGVNMRVGGLSAPLKVMSSQSRADTGELVTFAAGTVPSELITSFAGNGMHSMTIETKTAGVETMIRLGNTGAPQSLPRLIAECGKPAGDRAELSAKRANGIALAK